MRATVRLGVVLAAICISGIPGGTAAQAQTALRIGVSSSGSVFYTLGVGLSAMLTKYANISSNAEPVGGSTANMFALGADKVDLAIANAGASYDAFHGNKPFKKKTAVRLIAQGAPNMRQIVVRVGSGIEKPEDLVGKTIIGRRPALPEVGLITDALLKVYKIDPSQVKIISTTNTGEAVNAIKSGTVDAVVMPGSAGAGYMRRLMREKDIQYLKIPDDKMKAIIGMLPKYISITQLPANTYENQPNAINVFGLATYMVAAARVSDDTAYKVTKTLFDHIDEFHGFHAAAKEWTLKEALEPPTIPYHPGAIKYFKEKGVWTPELEKLQAELKP
jgi:TRAP transporter TAXI family solute receptor